MKLYFDFYSLMFKLSKLKKKEEIIQLFTESIQKVFRPAVAEYRKCVSIKDESTYEIRTRNSQFGFIVIKIKFSIYKNARVLIDNAVQMLAIILEQLEFEIEKECEKKSCAQIDIENTDGSMRTIKEPKGFRSATINLAEDFSNKVKKQTQAEEAIKMSEIRLKRAELASKSGNWELHIDTLKIIASDGATKIFGITGDNFDYTFIKKFTLSEYRPLLDRTLKNLLKEISSYDIEFKIKAEDTGQIKDIHSIATFDQKKGLCLA